MDFIDGQNINGYRLIERLGSGGMGSVYRAYHEAMKREVAVKILALDFADDPQYVARFNREAETLVQLEHPHIVPIYDYGTYQKFSYIVMRLLMGGSLEDKLRQGQPFELAQVHRIFEQVTSALQYAHEQGIIHRDIKPNNVMLDSAGYAYLTDFGIAKLVYETGQFTTTGTTLGTPMYMAPELWKGEQSSVKSDIYGLGILLYQLLVNKLPFTAPTPFALMDKHLHEMPQPISVQRGDTSDGLDAVIWQSLAKLPEERFDNVQAFYASFANAIQYDLSANSATNQALPLAITPPSRPPQETDLSITPQLGLGGLQDALPDKETVITNIEHPALSATEAQPRTGSHRLRTIVLAFVALIIILGGLWVVFAMNDTEEPADIVAQNTLSPTPEASLAPASLTVTENTPTPFGLLQSGDSAPQPIYTDETIQPLEDSILVLTLANDAEYEMFIQADSQIIFRYDESSEQIAIEFMDNSTILWVDNAELFSSPPFIYRYGENSIPLSFAQTCSLTEYMADSDTLPANLTTTCVGEDTTCQINDELTLDSGQAITWDLGDSGSMLMSDPTLANVDTLTSIADHYPREFTPPNCLIAYLSEQAEVSPTATPSKEDESPTPTPSLTDTLSPSVTPTRVVPTSTNTSVPPTNTLRPPTNTFVPPTNTPRPPATSTPVPPTAIIPTVAIPTVNVIPTTGGLLE